MAQCSGVYNIVNVNIGIIIIMIASIQYVLVITHPGVLWFINTTTA